MPLPVKSTRSTTPHWECSGLTLCGAWAPSKGQRQRAFLKESDLVAFITLQKNFFDYIMSNFKNHKSLFYAYLRIPGQGFSKRMRHLPHAFRGVTADRRRAAGPVP